MKPHVSRADDPVGQAIRNTGARVTWPRQRTLALLQEASGPLSHTEIEATLAHTEATGIDRVTLYRVLDWLVRKELAHKAVDARGVFRFSAARPTTDHSTHFHFRCTDCGRVFCLDAPAPAHPQLPQGFRLATMAIDLCGQCPHCSGEIT
jgi:Fur family transcriptional regulator, ferric uptake regulator